MLQELRRAVADKRLIADSHLAQAWMRTLLVAARETEALGVEQVEALIDEFGLDAGLVRTCIERTHLDALPWHRPAEDARRLAAS